MNGVLAVSVQFDPARRVPVGRLALDRGIAVLEYDGSYIGGTVNINPLMGTPSPGLVRPLRPAATEYVHGVFADSLPDAWGRVLIDRRLQLDGGSWRALTALEKLAVIGRGGRGALVYEPVHDLSEPLPEQLDLDVLARDTREVLEGDAASVVRQLQVLGGSSGGARPKVHVALNDDNRAVPPRAVLPSGFSEWIVKFAGTADRLGDIGPVEAAYAETARRAGITVPRTRLIPSRSGPGYFATERFDRGRDGRRIHALSAAGALGHDWSLPEFTYEELIQLGRTITRADATVVELFRRMVFNVVAFNRDDHTKQHAFLMQPTGQWSLAPAYDLTFSDGINGWHYLTVNGKGRDIERADLLAVARNESVKNASDIIDQVSEAVRALPTIARENDCTRETVAEIRRETERTLGRIAASITAVQTPKRRARRPPRG